jgi:hypothetical protein
VECGWVGGGVQGVGKLEALEVEGGHGWPIRAPPMAVTRIVNLVEEPQSTFDISASTTSPVHTALQPIHSHTKCLE